jgi:hypothetical protein
MEKELTFKETVEKIRRNIKKEDVSEICRRAGFLTTNTYYQACGKENWGQLTGGQQRTIEEAMKFIAEREGLKRQFANL